MSFLADPFSAAANTFMGLLQTPPHQNNHRFDEQSERDLLITLSVQMEHIRRTVNWLVIAVGVMLAGIVPLSILMVLETVAIALLWRGVP